MGDTGKIGLICLLLLGCTQVEPHAARGQNYIRNPDAVIIKTKMTLRQVQRVCGEGTGGCTRWYRDLILVNYVDQKTLKDEMEHVTYGPCHVGESCDSGT